MPIFHTQYSGKANDQSGKEISVNPRQVLQMRGPVVQVSVTVAQKISEQLIQQSIEVPEPVSGWALIDTGASNTCIDNTIATNLHLPVIDQVKMASATHNGTLSNVYPVFMRFIGVPIEVNAERVIGAELGNQGLIILLGRDLLQNFTMFYNGITGQITISA